MDFREIVLRQGINHKPVRRGGGLCVDEGGGPDLNDFVQNVREKENERHTKPNVGCKRHHHTRHDLAVIDGSDMVIGVELVDPHCTFQEADIESVQSNANERGRDI